MLPSTFSPESDCRPAQWTDERVNNAFSIYERHFGENFPVTPKRSRLSRLWRKVEGWKWNIHDAWLCLRGTHHATESL